MTIPKKLKIGNLTYTIRELVKDEDLFDYGRTVESNQSIGLSPTASQEHREQTFFHEVTHAILSHAGYFDETKNEKLVNTLSCGIYQVLKENKLLKQ